MWSVIGGAAVVVLAATAIITLVRSGRRAADGDGFWRAAPRPAAAMLLLIFAPGLAIVGTPWAVAAACVILAPGLWGVVAAVARVVRWPDQPAG
jgi:hypothetical protein